MGEGHPTRVQVNASVRVGAFRAVLQVPFDGVAYRRELHPNLVVSAGFQVNFHQGVPIAFGDDSVVQNRLLGVRPLAHKRLVVFAVPSQAVFQARLPISLQAAVRPHSIRRQRAITILRI